MSCSFPKVSRPSVIGTASPLGFIYGMIVYEGDVYVGGFFQSMNGVPAVGVARWDGNDWHPVGVPDLLMLLSHWGPCP